MHAHNSSKIWARPKCGALLEARVLDWSRANTSCGAQCNIRVRRGTYQARCNALRSKCDLELLSLLVLLVEPSFGRGLLGSIFSSKISSLSAVHYATAPLEGLAALEILSAHSGVDKLQ